MEPVDGVHGADIKQLKGSCCPCQANRNSLVYVRPEQVHCEIVVAKRHLGRCSRVLET